MTINCLSTLIKKLYGKNKRIDYRDVLYSKHYKVNTAYGKGERWAEPIRRIIEKQAIYPLQFGEDLGLTKMCRFASTGKAHQAVREVKKVTKPIYRDQLEISDVCGALYSKSMGLFFYDYPETRKSPIGECSCAFPYIDVCLIGARIAELDGDYKNAKLLYGRAKRATDHKRERTISFEKECDERNWAWKKAMKRMYKVGGLKLTY